jgi:glycerol-3-phosphate dehydrogenase
MRRDPGKLRDGTFDLLVIGAGIHGAFIGWDAALRGLRVAVVDRGDFGAATSANSLRIVHGGLRYLVRGDLPRMRESIRERSALLRIAPQLVEPLPVLVPTSAGSLVGGRLAHRAALAANDVLSFTRNRGLDPTRRLPSGRLVSREETLRLSPWLPKEHLSGGALWYDARVRYPERLTLSFVCAAYRQGAVPANYVRVDRLLVDQERVGGAAVTDVIDGTAFEIKAQAVVVAAGPWTRGLIACTLGGVQREGPTGALALNVVIRRQLAPVAVGVQTRSTASESYGAPGSRYLFIHPQQDTTMLGTWYAASNGKDVAAACEQAAARLIQEFNQACPALDLSLDDVVRYQWGWLPENAGQKAGAAPVLAERPVILNHGIHDGVRHLFSVEAVKYTTARAVAETVVDRVVRDLEWRVPACTTANVPLNGTRDEISPPGGDPLSHARTVRAIREEMAVKLSDIMLRRFPNGPAPTFDRATIEHIAGVAAAELGWDLRRREEEVEAVLRQTAPGATLLEAVG